MNYGTLLGTKLASGPLPYDEEAPVVEELTTLGYIDLHKVAADAVDDFGVRVRSHIRYLSALLPHLDRKTLALALHGIVNNKSITVSDVRLILDGRALYDPSRKTREVPVERIQIVGKMLTSGESKQATANAAGVSIDTVTAIDTFLGLTSAWDARMLTFACDAVREGVSVRKFGARENIPKSTAHRLIVKAREVLTELGEL